MENFKEKDYSYLTGKILPAKNLEGVSTVRIVDVDYDIGITIVNADDTDQYIYCWIGPTAYKNMTGEGVEDAELHEAAFTRMVELLERDEYDHEVALTIFQETSTPIGYLTATNPDADSCAFNL